MKSPGDKKKEDQQDNPGGSGAKDGGATIQRIVCEVGAGTIYPVLTKTNYSDWARLMKVKLKARTLWWAIDVGNVELQEDMMALDTLCFAMPPEMATAMADKDTAKQAWGTIATMRIGDECVKHRVAATA